MPQKLFFSNAKMCFNVAKSELFNVATNYFECRLKLPYNVAKNKLLQCREEIGF